MNISYLKFLLTKSSFKFFSFPRYFHFTKVAQIRGQSSKLRFQKDTLEPLEILDFHVNKNRLTQFLGVDCGKSQIMERFRFNLHPCTQFKTKVSYPKEKLCT